MPADFKKVKKEAAQLLRDLGIARPPVRVLDIVKKMGIEIKPVKLKPDLASQFSGALLLEKNKQGHEKTLMLLNSELSTNRTFFTAAHELGHYLLHRDYIQTLDYKMLARSNTHPAGKKPKEEIEADAFAAELLVPYKMLDDLFGDKEFYEAMKSADPEGLLHDLSKIFLVSRGAVEKRLKRYQFGQHSCIKLANKLFLALGIDRDLFRSSLISINI